MCLEPVGRDVGADWSLREDTVRGKGNGTHDLACDLMWCVFFVGRGVLRSFISELSLLA